MKRFALIPALLLFGFTAFSQMQPINSAALPPLVSVSGTGEVKVQPDEIMLNLAVDVRGKTLEEARKQNDEKVASILNYLKKYGVEAKHVQTAFMNVHPIYNSGEYGQTNPDFYSAQKTVSVLVKKVDKFDELLSGIYKAGANRVDGIEFRSSQLQKHRDEARKLAVQAAKEKAVLLTSQLGAKVGRVYAISENTGGGFPVPYRGVMMNKMSEAASMDAGGPTIAGGQITVSSTVEASFVIEQ
ncbi:SIMPL domain-containing protein [Adhaeribacter terreus]|uniref:SIMPL domain-containing protein n=1 Tax=Adhaeribacter terreus TaxID=529703 RepID=A0ABW0E746_9BACT